MRFFFNHFILSFETNLTGCVSMENIVSEFVPCTALEQRV